MYTDDTGHTYHTKPEQPMVRKRGRAPGWKKNEKPELPTGQMPEQFDVSTENLEKPDTIEAIDVSDERAEKVARGYFVGSTAVGRRKDVRKMLEDKVITKIGKSGKLLVDKLFELVEGVAVVDRLSKVQGKEEVRYYKTPPNLAAIIYALDRVLGKPKQLNVQANFSLSELLIKSEGNSGPLNNNTTKHGNGQRDNEEVPDLADILH